MMKIERTQTAIQHMRDPVLISPALVHIGTLSEAFVPEAFVSEAFVPDGCMVETLRGTENQEKAAIIKCRDR